MEAPSAAGPSVEREPDIRIRPSRGWQRIGFGELWRFRHLLWLFALRDVTVRYKQTVLGGLWAILQPLVQVVVFTFFFGKLMGLEDRLGTYNGKEVAYPVFVLSGQVLWNYFNASVNGSSGSLLANANILRKIYVPRLVIPISTTGAPTVDMLIASGMLLLVMFYYSVVPGVMILLAPLLMVAAWLAALSVGVMLSALIVTYRDFRFVTPFMLQIWFFITPVIYPPNLLPERYEMLLYINPMTGVIETFRALILNGPINWLGLAISMATALIVLTGGLFYFARVERRFADIA